MPERERKKYIEGMFDVKLRRHRGYWTIWKKERRVFEYQFCKWKLHVNHLFNDLDEVLWHLDEDRQNSYFVYKLTYFDFNKLYKEEE